MKNPDRQQRLMAKREPRPSSTGLGPFCFWAPFCQVGGSHCAEEQLIPCPTDG